MPEGGPKNNGESSSYRPGEDLVANVHSHVDAIKNGSATERSALEHFRQEIADSDYSEMYHQYHNGKVPTLSSLQKSAQRAAEELDAVVEEEKKNGLSEEDLAEEIALRNILLGRVKEVRSSIRAYIRTVIQYHNIKVRRQRGAMDDEDLKYRFEQIDTRRRQAHNTLLESLREMTRALRTAKKEDLLKTPLLEWGIGMPLSHQIQADSLITFSESVTDNRDYICDWAIVADLDDRLGEIGGALN